MLPAVVLALLLAAPARGAIIRAESILPPGESGFVSLTGLLQGTGSPHLYDQQSPFIAFSRKDAMLGQHGTEEDPRVGVRIVRDAFGVPAVYGTTSDAAWWGAGYATAQDRLFELEAFRAATTGHLAEITGRGNLAMDIEVRRDFYTPPEVHAMLAALPPEMQQRYAAYRDGVNAWVAHVQGSVLDEPAEYVATGTPVRPFTLEDLGAIGAYLARTTPNGDGDELTNAHALQASGARALNTILPLRTPGQIATIPRANGSFPSVPGRSAKQERAALRRSSAFVSKLPLPAVSDDGRTPQPAHSSMVAIGDRAHHRAFLFSGPELGFSAPEELYEIEVHAPGLDVRGVTAPGAPVVAIGHNAHVAWGVTSGLTETNHLYAEQLVPGHPEEYMFRGKVRTMDCRNERFTWHSPPSDLLSGKLPTDSGTETVRLCRTVHGPVQARAGNVAYARKYATWMREAETINGLAQVDAAGSVARVDVATAGLTWNENLMAADDQGHIGYWHPGLLPIKPRRWDERLPYPGTGEAEWGGFLPVRRRPHVIDPKQGWLANWNNIPSQGWTTGNDPAPERVAGTWFRVHLLDRLAAVLARNPSFAGLQAMIHEAGSTAQQRPLAGPQLRRALKGATGAAAVVLQTILAWDGSYDRTDAAGKLDPGAATWQAFKTAAQALAIAPLGEAGKMIGGGSTNPDHVYDASLGQAFALRTLKAAGWRTAAANAFAALSKQYGSADPASWRAPRSMFKQTIQGAEQPPPMPFFDRGTWEQLVQLGS
ncbi:MAG: Peptidase penicillin amidase [Solirubrobacterales bacterium]|nr:Peptidase penicillin amidase [Solirubrobacterales bacterium]